MFCIPEDVLAFTEVLVKVVLKTPRTGIYSGFYDARMLETESSVSKQCTDAVRINCCFFQFSLLVCVCRKT